MVQDEFSQQAKLLANFNTRKTFKVYCFRFISLVHFLTIQRVPKDIHLIRQFVLGKEKLFVFYQILLSCFV